MGDMKRKIRSKISQKKPTRKLSPLKNTQKFKIEPEPLPTSTQKPSTAFAALSYAAQFFNILILGSGAIFSVLIYIVASRKFTKFHALQSFFLGIVLSLLSFILSDGITSGNTVIDVISYPYVYMMVGVLVVVSFVLLSFKAYKHEWFEIPFFGGVAKRYS